MPTHGPQPLSWKHRWLFAAAFCGVWGPITIFVTHRTTLFVIYYQASPASLATVGIVCGLIDAFTGPLIAQMADSALLNKLSCFPLAGWGRRAPLILMGTPLLIAGPSLMWLAPNKDRLTLGVWYALCYMLLVIGSQLTLQSYLSSIQELFPTGGERALAVVRQTPFMVLTYIIAGAGPAILAFTANPSTEGSCCLTARYDCLEIPPCACFATGVTASSARAATDWYTARFVDVCGNSSTVQSLASGELALASAALEAERQGACTRPSIPRLRFAFVALLTIALGLLAWLAVPPARSSGGTKYVPSTLSLRHAVLTTFSQRPFVVYASSMFLGTTWTSFLLSNLGIYLVYVTQIEPKSLGFLQILLIGIVLVARIVAIPFFAKLLLRFPKRCHPARLGAALKLLEAALTPIIFLALKLPQVDVLVVIVVCGLVFGVLQSPQDMISHMLIGWAIDEDAACRNFQRREGMFYGCNGLTQHFSQVLVASVLGMWGSAGFDPALCASDQPSSAYHAIEMTFVIGMPICSLLNAIVLLLYPIQGERLLRLRQAKGIDDKSGGEIATDDEIEQTLTRTKDAASLIASPMSPPPEGGDSYTIGHPDAAGGTSKEDSRQKAYRASSPDGNAKRHQRRSTWTPPSGSAQGDGLGALAEGVRSHRRTLSWEQPPRSSMLVVPPPVGSQPVGSAADYRDIFSASMATAGESAAKDTSSLHIRTPSADVVGLLATLRSEIHRTENARPACGE
jgi:Na+/melibiose symporter-like transporter